MIVFWRSISLILSRPLIELHVRNIWLETKKNMDLVLDSIGDSFESEINLLDSGARVDKELLLSLAKSLSQERYSSMVQIINSCVKRYVLGFHCHDMYEGQFNQGDGMG